MADSTLYDEAHLIATLRIASKMVNKGEVSKALDIVFDEVDDMLYEREFSTLDSFLRSANVKDYPVDILVSLLTTTLPAHSFLPNRGGFFGRVRKYLESREDYEAGLLDGLEGGSSA